MKPMTLKLIAEVVNGTVLGIKKEENLDVLVHGVRADSRKVQQGDLFIPIKGERVDGHDFIEMAFKKDAVCSFSEKEIEPIEGKFIIYVESVQKALLELAEYYLKFFPELKIVGVTGSVGKTTTKDIIASVLMQRYTVLKTEGNYNTNIGLPLMAFQINEEHEVAVLEMGMNSFGEIHNLSKVTKPDIAVITNVGVAHIEMLGSREGILKAKCEIFDYMTSEGTAILNGDNDMLQTLNGRLQQKILWYGVENKQDIYADHIQIENLQSTRCILHTPKGSVEVVIPVPGQHLVQNALAAVAVGLELGLSLKEIKMGIETFSLTKMRMGIEYTKSGITIINDVYNANPVSMKAAIDVLVSSKERKVCILGDMGELGEHGEEMHREVGAYAAEKGIDIIICIGTLTKASAEGARNLGAKNVFHYDTQENFWQEGLKMISEGDVVLVKASRSRGFEKTVEKIQGVK